MLLSPPIEKLGSIPVSRRTADIDEDDDADDTEDASSLEWTRSSFFFFASATGPSLFPSSDENDDND